MIVFFVFFSLQLIKLDYKQNLLIFIILILMVPQFSVYHKYYDPLVLILFFTLLNTSLNLKFFKNKFNIIYLFVFYVVFISMRVIKNYFF